MWGSNQANDALISLMWDTSAAIRVYYCEMITTLAKNNSEPGEPILAFQHFLIHKEFIIIFISFPTLTFLIFVSFFVFVSFFYLRPFVIHIFSTFIRFFLSSLGLCSWWFGVVLWNRNIWADVRTPTSSCKLSFKHSHKHVLINKTLRRGQLVTDTESVYLMVLTCWHSKSSNRPLRTVLHAYLPMAEGPWDHVWMQGWCDWHREHLLGQWSCEPLALGGWTRAVGGEDWPSHLDSLVSSCAETIGPRSSQHLASSLWWFAMSPCIEWVL